MILKKPFNFVLDLRSLLCPRFHPFIFFAFSFFTLHYNVMAPYFSNKLSIFISNHKISYFVLDILHSDVLLGPYFDLICECSLKNPFRRRGKTPYTDSIRDRQNQEFFDSLKISKCLDHSITGELCNFIFLEQSEITLQNITPLVGDTILYQFPSPVSVEYHLRFVRILSIDPDKNTIQFDYGNATISDLRRRSPAFRIWLPFRLYIDKIVEFM